MYAAIYGYDSLSGNRNHLGNVRHIDYTHNNRTYDFSATNITGYCDFEMGDALIYVIKTESGRPLTSGFIKNIKKLSENEISFNGDDFKRILDTDILIDFTNDKQPNFTLKSMFERVSNAIRSSNRDSYISKIELNFIIPNDFTDVRVIADYTGQYHVVNALKFLKVYLSYYGYFITSEYNVVSDVIRFEYKKSNPQEITEIKLIDFKHDQTSSDIKVNKAIATIAFSPAGPFTEWEESNESYYYSQPIDNRVVMKEADGLPPTTGYPIGFALGIIGTDSWYKWVPATELEWEASSNKQYSVITRNGGYCSKVPLLEAIASVGSPDQYSIDTVIAVSPIIMHEEGMAQICPKNTRTFIKISYDLTVLKYFKLGEVSFAKRPNLPERVYLLGKDNKIYDGYNSITEDKRIYPIVTKIFEAKYLAEAQVNAVYEIVNNRYAENIIITIDKIVQPIDLANLELYTMIRVYDSLGEYKDLPISEKTTTHNIRENRVEIKLGFKKTLLTEIIKNDISDSEVVKSSGGSGGISYTNIPNNIHMGSSQPAKPHHNQIWIEFDEDESTIEQILVQNNDKLEDPRMIKGLNVIEEFEFVEPVSIKGNDITNELKKDESSEPLITKGSDIIIELEVQESFSVKGYGVTLENSNENGVPIQIKGEDIIEPPKESIADEPLMQKGQYLSND